MVFVVHTLSIASLFSAMFVGGPAFVCLLIQYYRICQMTAKSLLSSQEYQWRSLKRISEYFCEFFISELVLYPRCFILLAIWYLMCLDLQAP